MANSFCCLDYHFVFSTKRRYPWISPKWIREAFPTLKGFGWQDGYGAFTVSRSNVPQVVDYIAGQREHHRVRTFQEEYRELLARHGIPFNERYLWGLANQAGARMPSRSDRMTLDVGFRGFPAASTFARAPTSGGRGKYLVASTLGTAKQFSRGLLGLDRKTRQPARSLLKEAFDWEQNAQQYRCPEGHPIDARFIAWPPSVARFLPLPPECRPSGRPARFR